MVTRTYRTIPLALVLLGLGSVPSIVRAQSNSSFNPYGNSGYQDYREFSYPSYSNNPALPGQARLNGEPMITRPRSNTYRQSLDEDDGDFESNLSRRGSSAGTPYNEAYQRLNRQYKNIYKPNNNPQNQEFVDRMKKRDQEYAEALQEKDPVKRSQKLRQLERGSTDKSASAARPKEAATSRAPEPNAPSRGSAISRAPAPNSSTTRRTAPAPAPGTAAPRRSGTSTAPPVPGSRPANGTGTRAPATRSAPPDPSTIAVPPPG